jgi:hypothetical protein
MGIWLRVLAERQQYSIPLSALEAIAPPADLTLTLWLDYTSEYEPSILAVPVSRDRMRAHLPMDSGLPTIGYLHIEVSGCMEWIQKWIHRLYGPMRYHAASPIVE